MRPVVITDPPRASREDVAALRELSVATTHEAIGRTGLLDPGLRPIQTGVRIAGTAVTVQCWPGDNLMIHAAIEQCRRGDVLVVTTSSASTDGMIGELIATALQVRGVVGVVTTTGVRDTQQLRVMSFPVWSAGVHAQGTVKATAGSVNVPIAIGRTVVHPGDVVVADDDGVVVVPRRATRAAIEASRARAASEEEARTSFAGGELSLDRYGLRSLLAELGVEYTKSGGDGDR
jgi:4-hydroxy-4-methyl-2-oxoglutarate aldolase